MVETIDIFESTRSGKHRSYFLNVPESARIAVNTTIPWCQQNEQCDAFIDSLRKLFDGHLEVEFLIKILQMSDQATLKSKDSIVTLRGGGNEDSKFVLWYEIVFNDGKENMEVKVIREIMCTQKDMNWIYNKQMTLNTVPQNVVAIDFPVEDDDTLFAPFFILLMLRTYCNNIRYFYPSVKDGMQQICEDENEHLVPLYFMVPMKFGNENSLKEYKIKLSKG